MKTLIQLLKEELDARSAAGQLRAAFKSDTVSGFVDRFKKIASDPKVQAILKAGRNDKDPNDEVLKYSEKQLPVKNLIPTQSEIGFDQSIGTLLTDEFGSLSSILDGTANVGGPIVTYNGKYVIDGHHRWSQVFAGNPDAKMEAIDIQGNLKPTEILKVVHAAIASKVGGVPSANPKGINILKGVKYDEVLKKTKETLTDKARKVWEEHGSKSEEEIAKHIFNHLSQLIRANKPVPGAPPRKDMPQTDTAKTPATDKLTALKKGMINFINPASSDTQPK